MKFKTKYHGPKPFAWSYSRLKNYEVCPRKYNEVDIKKTFSEGPSEALAEGDRVHKAAAARLGPSKTKLPSDLAKLEKYCAAIEKGSGEVMVEQKLAMTADHKPCGFFADDVWVRAVADVIKLDGPIALLVDWKTGKIVEDIVQLGLTSAIVMQTYPQLKAIRADYIWLKYKATSKAVITRDDLPEIWAQLEPRVEALKHAHDTKQFEPKKSGLCRFCPVRSCEYNDAE